MLLGLVTGHLDHHEEVGGVAGGGQHTTAVTSTVDGAVVVGVLLHIRQACRL